MAQLFDVEIDEKIFESEILTFSVPLEAAADFTEDTMVNIEGGDYYIIEVEKVREADGQAFFRVTAEAAWMRLADRKMVGSLMLNSFTPYAGLTAILTDTDWTIDECTADNTTFNMEATDASVLALIWEWAKICGCEAQFNTVSRTITFRAEVGSDTRLQLRYGTNLTSIKRKSTAPSVTRMYAYGRFGLSIADLTASGESYLEDYSWYTAQGMSLPQAQALYRKDEIYSDDSFLAAQALYDATQARLAIKAQGTITYEASVVDLSEAIGVPAFNFRPGDRVGVYDEILNINVVGRITRKLKYPQKPHTNRVELGFSKLELPDSNISTERPSLSEEWVLFQSTNTQEKRIRNGSTILHRISLTTVENAQWIISFKIAGVGVGAGTVTLTFIDDETAIAFLPSRTITHTDGVYSDYEFTFANDDVPVGTYTMVIRASSSGAAVGMNLAIGETSFWILAKGATRNVPTLANSQAYAFTGAIQYFTVPSDVTWVQAEVVGARGGHGTFGGTQGGGSGGLTSGKFPVVAGTTLDVHVGGAGENDSINTFGGWPNGGNGGVGSGTNKGAGGGGASYITSSGGAITAAYLVAGGGGGHADTGASRPSGSGVAGDAGFFDGTAGDAAGAALGGGGASQTAAGIGGVAPVTNGEAGDVDGTGQGGDGATASNSFVFPAGGGGGGWHGGGGGGDSDFIGGGQYGSDGGGGSGWADLSVWDLYYEDAMNTSDGYILISWETPE